MKAMLNTLRKVNDADVSFIGYIKTCNGFEEIALGPEEVVKYIKDRDQFGADYFQVPVDVYKAWCDSNGSIRCTAKNRYGTRCEKILFEQLPLDEWMNNQVTLCSFHNGTFTPANKKRH